MGIIICIFLPPGFSTPSPSEEWRGWSAIRRHNENHILWLSPRSIVTWRHARPRKHLSIEKGPSQQKIFPSCPDISSFVSRPLATSLGSALGCFWRVANRFNASTNKVQIASTITVCLTEGSAASCSVHCQVQVTGGLSCSFSTSLTDDIKPSRKSK